MKIIQEQTDSHLSFYQFLENLPDEAGDYELVNEQIVRRRPTRNHDDIADAITDTLRQYIRQHQENFHVSGRIFIRTETSSGVQQGRHPDVVVVNRRRWEESPMAPSALLDPPQLAVEVVSTNWEDDYVDKFEEYQRFAIPEYWIVDYLAVGSRQYLGNPKEPTLFICTLQEDNTYKMAGYRWGDRLKSSTFPQLDITVENLCNL